LIKNHPEAQAKKVVRSYVSGKNVGLVAHAVFPARAGNIK
jgi:hypothetical protein